MEDEKIEIEGTRAFPMNINDAMLMGRCLMDYLILIHEKKVPQNYTSEELEKLDEISLMYNLSIIRAVNSKYDKEPADAKV